MNFKISTIALFAAALIPGIVAVPIEDIPTNGTLSESSLLGAPQYCRLNLHYCGWNLVEKFSMSKLPSIYLKPLAPFFED
jgi:hypothetical protein